MSDMPETFDLTRDEQGRLLLHLPAGSQGVLVRPRRAFPWSMPDRHISLRCHEGREVLLIADLALLPASQAALVRQQLESHTFIPRITRIASLETRFGVQHWSVVTDRGACEFRVQEREDTRFLPDGRIAIRDMDGTVYELPSAEHLDPHSRKLLERIL